MEQSYEPFNEMDVDLLLTLLPIRPYEHVMIAGCSNTALCISLAKYLNQGKLYALDSDNEILDKCKEILTNIPLTNFLNLNYDSVTDYFEEQSIDGILIDYGETSQSSIDQILDYISLYAAKSAWISVIEHTSAKGKLASSGSMEQDIKGALNNTYRHIRSREVGEYHILHSFRM